MQLSCASLLNCRGNLDWIISKHETDLGNPNKVFYQSTFFPRRIKLDGSLRLNFKLESGVAKNQGSRDDHLDDEEKSAVKTFLVEENEDV